MARPVGKAALSGAALYDRVPANLRQSPFTSRRTCAIRTLAFTVVQTAFTSCWQTWWTSSYPPQRISLQRASNPTRRAPVLRHVEWELEHTGFTCGAHAANV